MVIITTKATAIAVFLEGTCQKNGCKQKDGWNGSTINDIWCIFLSKNSGIFQEWPRSKKEFTIQDFLF